MTSPFQTELRDRAAAHAREWEVARDPSVGLIEVETTVRRRRRGRGLLAGAGSIALVGLVAAAAYVGLGRGGDTNAVASPYAPAIAALANVRADDVVLSAYGPNPSRLV